MRNRGTVTVEACLVVPIFLFFMMIVTRLTAMLLADAKIHQSLAEAAGYTAQYCYLEDRLKKNGTVSDIVNNAMPMRFARTSPTIQPITESESSFKFILERRSSV